jgi:uncharacterized protein YdaU (DUF1376 family)
MMDSHVMGMTYAPFYPSDWRSGCLILNLEEEGLYVRIIAYMYDTGRAIPANHYEGARLLNVHYNKYVKVVSSLIEKGKIIKAQNWLINEKVQEVMDKYRREHAARSAAAKAREDARKKYLQQKITEAVKRDQSQAYPPRNPPSNPPSYPGGNPPSNPPSVLPPTQGVTQGVTYGVQDEKPNENNGGHITVVPPACHGSDQAGGHKPETRSQKLKEEKKDIIRDHGNVVASGTSFNGTKAAALDLLGEPEPTPKKEKRATQLPPDWTPGPDLIDWVKGKWIATAADISRQAEQFLNHHRAKGSKMKDWNAAWRTWWGNGFHRIPLRGSAYVNDVDNQELADAFERARLADEARHRC